MKKCSIVALLSSCLTFSSFCTTAETSCETAQSTQVKRYERAKSLTSQFDERLTFDTIEGITYLYIELKREDASDVMWEHICELVEQQLPETNAQRVGAEADTVSYTCKRNNLHLLDWDATINAYIMRFNDLKSLLSREKCSGAVLQMVLDYMVK